MKSGVISQKDFDATWELVKADEEAIRTDERKKIIEMIKGMYLYDKDFNGIPPLRAIGYNQALNDIIKKLEEL